MTRDTAIHLARQTLANKSIGDFEFFKASREQRGNRGIWLVIFALREKVGVVTTPDTVFVEVDEENQVASIVLNP